MQVNKMFTVHNLSQWPNPRHLGEPLGGAVNLLAAVSSKEAMESMCRYVELQMLKESELVFNI